MSVPFKVGDMVRNKYDLSRHLKVTAIGELRFLGRLNGDSMEYVYWNYDHELIPEDQYLVVYEDHYDDLDIYNGFYSKEEALEAIKRLKDNSFDRVFLVKLEETTQVDE